MSTSFIEELRWRKMLHNITPGVEEFLASGSRKGYVGFDPTADSLGVGNLVQVMMLVHFQRAGHEPVALLGGATGMIGDPSFKAEERKLLSKDILNKNLSSQRLQIEKLLNKSAIVLDNNEWFGNFNFLDFIRDVGKHITVNYMLAKDSVKSRQDSGISFTEFSYQLVQAFDFHFLSKNKEIRLQMGGSDQWGNITTGIELNRRMGGQNSYAITTPLIKKADGTKFGKTEGGNIWLDPKRTSPYKFYQFWLNSSDVDSSDYIRIFTTKSKTEIEEIEEKHRKEPHLRILQKELALDVTERVHSAQHAKKAIKTSEILFGKGTTEMLKELSENDLLDVFSGVPIINVSLELLNPEISVINLVTANSSLFKSRGEAKKLIQAGAVSINKSKVLLDDFINQTNFLKDKYLIVQKGKKNYALVILE
ncbi:tyrosine--tRNA ligase [Schleiferiaceae bacterium]|nr:tyrosine--tRNA ligase [Schleiferiaceae bacterium]